MRNPRRVLSKAQILDRVWNYDFGGQANVVELYISYLRKKIDAGREPMIHTMRGAGYVLKPARVSRPPGGLRPPARPSPPGSLTAVVRWCAVVSLLVIGDGDHARDARLPRPTGSTTTSGPSRSSSSTGAGPERTAGPTARARRATRDDDDGPRPATIGTLTAVLARRTTAPGDGARARRRAACGPGPPSTDDALAALAEVPLDGRGRATVDLPGLGAYRVAGRPTADGRDGRQPGCRPTSVDDAVADPGRGCEARC